MNSLTSIIKTLKSPTAIKLRHFSSRSDFKNAIKEEEQDRKDATVIVRALIKLSDTHGFLIHNSLNKFNPPSGATGCFNVLITAIEDLCCEMADNEKERMKWLRRVLPPRFVDRHFVHRAK